MVNSLTGENLEDRRKSARLCMLSKFQHELIDIDRQQYLTRFKMATVKNHQKRLNEHIQMSQWIVSIDLAVIQNDLEAIKGKLEKVVKKNDLDQLFQSLVKKSDIELIITSIVTKLMDNLKKELDEKLEKKFIEKTGKQQKAIEELTKENEQLREITVEQRRTINSFKNSS
jgi:hypothetical protein